MEEEEWVVGGGEDERRNGEEEDSLLALLILLRIPLNDPPECLLNFPPASPSLPSPSMSFLERIISQIGIKKRSGSNMFMQRIDHALSTLRLQS